MLESLPPLELTLTPVGERIVEQAQRVLEDALWHIGRVRPEAMLRPVYGMRMALGILGGFALATTAGFVGAGWERFAGGGRRY